jgi:gas vesicle protein
MVVGIALGAGIALLFAPQAGYDTRRALVRRGARLGSRGRDAWDDLRHELRRAVRRRRRARERVLPPAGDVTAADEG